MLNSTWPYPITQGSFYGLLMGSRLLKIRPNRMGASMGFEAATLRGRSTIAQETKANTTLNILRTSEIPRPGRLPVALIAHTTTNRDGSTTYRVRCFVASDWLDTNYTPRFAEVALYGQVLFLHHDYSAAAPIFERGLMMAPSDCAPFQSATVARRVMRDQAGMSCRISAI
jgi:hypothetical protein